MKNEQGQGVLLHVKNMVCNRCIRVVREELEHLGVTVQQIALGEVVVAPGDIRRTDEIRDVLQRSGFELLDDRKSQVIEKIRHAVIELVYGDPEHVASVNFSEYIARVVGLDYHYLSTLFSTHEGITIEKFVIHQKIERVKELLKYGEHTLSEIAYMLGYSSVAHLSSQFKKTTGMSASQYRELRENDRRPIDSI
jgi:AraC family transcriptional regulator